MVSGFEAVGALLGLDGADEVCEMGQMASTLLLCARRIACQIRVKVCATGLGSREYLGRNHSLAPTVTCDVGAALPQG